MPESYDENSLEAQRRVVLNSFEAQLADPEVIDRDIVLSFRGLVGLSDPELMGAYLSVKDQRPTIALSLVSLLDRSWQTLAACDGKDPDMFFPGRGASVKAAKEVCRVCVVREECLEYALQNGEKFGVWGGMTERERRQFRRQSALAKWKR